MSIIWLTQHSMIVGRNIILILMHFCIQSGYILSKTHLNLYTSSILQSGRMITLPKKWYNDSAKNSYATEIVNFLWVEMVHRFVWCSFGCKGGSSEIFTGYLLYGWLNHDGTLVSHVVYQNEGIKTQLILWYTAGQSQSISNLARCF